MTSAFQALMRLGRELRYRPLPIIGTRIAIESLGDVERALRQLAAPWITRDARWDGSNIDGTLAKYGLIDRWCTVDPRELEGGLRGIRALRANGFAPGEPDPDPEIEAEARAFAADCIIDLAAGLGQSELKLFLQDGLSSEMRRREIVERFSAGQALELRPDYFPRSFVVVDACITNAPAIWLGKHFYL
jgi:hypothetical protein